MTTTIPRLISLLALLCGLWACNHAAEEEGLLGTWEGALPLPATGEDVPVTYEFRRDGLTVTVGLGPDRSVTEWGTWKVHAVEDGDLILHIERADGRRFSTLVRRRGEDELSLWDPGTEEDTAAQVRRVSGGSNGDGDGDGSGSGD